MCARGVSDGGAGAAAGRPQQLPALGDWAGGVARGKGGVDIIVHVVVGVGHVQAAGGHARKEHGRDGNNSGGQAVGRASGQAAAAAYANAATLADAHL